MPSITQSPVRPNGHTQHIHSPNPAKDTLQNIKDFLSNEVSAPLCLSKLSIGSTHHPVVRNSKRGSDASFLPKFDTDHDEIHFGDFLCTQTSYDDGQTTEVKHRTRDPNIKLLVDQALKVIYEKVGNITSLLLDQFEDRTTAHRVFVERTHICRQLFNSIQDISNHAFELGRHSGREDGLEVIRRVLGTNPTSARIHKFTTFIDDKLLGEALQHVVSNSHHRVGVSVDNMQERVSFMIPHQVEKARIAWESVEDHIRDLLMFQLSCILGSLNDDSDNWGDVEEDTMEKVNAEDEADEMYRRDLTKVLLCALDKTFSVGSFDGYHVAQERYKNLYGISNPWTYSFIDVNSDDALVVSKHSRVITKVALKSVSKRNKKI